jgi:hypothetical protein
LNLPLEEDKTWSSKPATFVIGGPVDLFFITRKIRRDMEKSCRCQVPTVLQAASHGQIWFDPLLTPTAKKQKVIEARVALDSVSNDIFKLDLGAKGAVYRDLGGWSFDPWLDSELTILKFKPLVDVFDAKGVLMPAPLQPLDGRIVIHAKSPVEVEARGRDASSITAGARLEVDLESKFQSVKLNAAAEVKTDSTFSAFDIGVKTQIEKIKLTLPPIEPIAGVPKLTRDSRIQLKPEPPRKINSKGVVVRFHFDVATAKRGAIQLYSNLTEPFIPVTLDLHGDKDATTGVVRLEPFRFVYLRRTLYVDSLVLKLNEDPDAGLPIAGNFRVKQTEYEIAIRVTGTVESPYIQLSSTPYLERADIISVLLYDRTRDQLAGGDAESVGNVQAAMADRAIGLFGLWAFANTPIRSVSYNPATKSYSATVLLGGGLTAGVGTTQDQSTGVQLRKRISTRWVVTASWQSAGKDATGDVGSIVLQWEKRF